MLLTLSEDLEVEQRTILIQTKTLGSVLALKMKRIIDLEIQKQINGNLTEGISEGELVTVLKISLDLSLMTKM